MGDGRDGRDGRGGRNGGPREEMLLRGITLSSDQQQRVDAIRARYRTQMETARQSGSVDRAAMRDMMEKQTAEIRAVLTADQQATFDRNVADMRARMEQGGGRRPNG
jgi:Spy/CpxP family protein refolding chaperone